MIRKNNLLSAAHAGVKWVFCSPWRAFIVLFLLACWPRLNQLNQFSRRYFVPTADRELGAITISLVKTGKFADTYVIPTGPTAHLPPIIPLIDSLIYRALGLTSQAGYVRAVIIVLTGSVLCGLLPWFSRRLGTGWAVGVLAGLVYALGGRRDSFWDILPGHGEFLAGLLLGLLLVTFVRRWSEGDGSWRGSLLLGLAAGAILHVQPALLPVILGCMLFELYWLKTLPKWAGVGVIALGIFLASLPWGLRNYNTFGAVFFIRSNLGHELRLGNNPEATFEEMNAKYVQYRSPRASLQEALKLIEVGEIEYMKQARDEALA